MPDPSRLAQLARRALTRIPWARMSSEEARAAALAGEHLVERGAGTLVGAPRGMTAAELPAMRERLDAAAKLGQPGAGWYQEARDVNQLMSAGDPRVAREMAAGEALYSPQATPEKALEWALAQRNLSLARSPEEAARRTLHYGYQAQRYGDVLAGAEPAEVVSGAKVEPFFHQVNPGDPAMQHMPVNDRWMGKLFGYQRKNKAGELAGFSESEHSFMTGEGIAAHQRAVKAGTLPPESDPSDWQAAAWTGMRMQQLATERPDLTVGELYRRVAGGMREAAEGLTAHETTELIPSRASEHLAGAVDLPLQQKERLTRKLAGQYGKESYDPYYRAFGMAQMPAQPGLGQFTETVPTAGEPLRFQPAFKRLRDNKVVPTVGYHNVDELPGARTRGYLPHEWDEGFVDQSGKYYTRVEAAQAAAEAGKPAGVYPMKSEFMPEELRLTSERLTSRETHFGEPQTRTDYNPNLTRKPLVSFETSKEGGKQLGKGEEEMLRSANLLRSATDVQAAGAYHAVAQSAPGTKHNAARILLPEPLEPELTSLLYERAAGDGLNLIDTGGGTFTLTGAFGQMPGPEFQKRATSLLSELERDTGARVTTGQYVGRYQELPQYGEGRVTRALVGPEGAIPARIGEKLDTAELRRVWAARNRAEREAAREFGLGRPRADVQKLRRILSKGGVEGLRRHVKTVGYGGLPAVAAGVAADEEGR